MSNPLVNERDQKFVLSEMLKVDELCKAEYFSEHSIETFNMLVDTANRMIIEGLWPIFQEADREGAKLVDGQAIIPECMRPPFETFMRDGWLTMDIPFEHGGQQMPHSVSVAVKEMVMAANPSFGLFVYSALGAGRMIQNFGDDRQKKLYMAPLYEGRFGGTMALTEPAAGSDVGALTTTAKPIGDGKYKITGTKIFITNGDQNFHDNIVHPVLARIEGDPAGTKGISIFLVPKIRINEDGTLGEPNDVQTVNVEHKMGIKASPTCTLNFGENDNCIGELLGEERSGMKIMFQMMNDARIAIGIQGVGTASASYCHALQYAKERIQGTAIENLKDPNAPKVPIIKHPDVRRMLMTMKAYAEGMRALIYYSSYCLDKEIIESGDDAKKWHDRLELITPIDKAYCSDMAFRVCEMGVQTYGGYGYCQEFPVEQFLRDCKIASIYEGANGIQAMDLVTRKFRMGDGKVMMSLMEDIGKVVKENAAGPLAEEAKILGQGAKILGEAVMHTMGSFGKGQISLGLMNATAVLELMGDVVLGWLLLWQAGIAQAKLEELAPGASGEALAQAAEKSGEVAFYAGKIATAKFFANRILTMAPGKAAVIQNQNQSALELPDEGF